MTDEKLKIWLGFTKFLLGTFALGLVTTLLSDDLKRKEIELKEQNQMGGYLEHALQEDVGVRYRFSQYFSKVTRSKELRERWEEYYEVVKPEYDEKKKEEKRLEGIKNKTPEQKDKLYQIKQEVSAKPSTIVYWFAVLASYPESQFNDAQEQARKIANQLKKEGRKLKVEIYKTKISRDYAITVGGRLYKEQALSMARMARERAWGKRRDAFAQKDRDWDLVQIIDTEGENRPNKAN